MTNFLSKINYSSNFVLDFYTKMLINLAKTKFNFIKIFTKKIYPHKL